LKKTQGVGTTELALEELYHKTMANEEEGIKQFRQITEELVRYQVLNQLLTLLNDVNNYPLQKENSRLWLKYYRANLREMRGRPEEAEPIYQQIADSTDAEDKLRAYALSDWAWTKRYTDFDEMEQIIERIHHLFPEPEALPEPDAKLGFYLLELGEAYRGQGKSWNDTLACFERARKFYETIGDSAWLAFTYNRLKYGYMDCGMWKEGWEARQQGLQEIKKLTGEQQSYLRAEFLGSLSIGWMWIGRLSETEKEIREALMIVERFGRTQQGIYFYRDLGLVLGLQGKLEESEEWYQRGIEVGFSQDPLYDAVTDGFQGWVALLWEGAEKADHFLTSSIDKFRQQTKRTLEMPRLLNCYGMIKEVMSEFELAEKAYIECLDIDRKSVV
jgi:tetratricopeptide (TPR) repeat protein